MQRVDVRRPKCLRQAAEGLMPEALRQHPQWRWRLEPLGRHRSRLLCFSFVSFSQQACWLVLLTPRAGSSACSKCLQPYPELCWAKLVGCLLLKLAPSVNYHTSKSRKALTLPLRTFLPSLIYFVHNTCLCSITYKLSIDINRMLIDFFFPLPKTSFSILVWWEVVRENEWTLLSG